MSSQDQKNIQTHLPWYAIIIIGLVISGLVPWMIISWSLYRQEKKRTAFLIFIINILLFLVLNWIFFQCTLRWRALTLIVYFINGVWAFFAWLWSSRYYITGHKIRKRPEIIEWKTWAPPMMTGALLGFSMGSVVFMLNFIGGESWDIPGYSTILLEFIRYGIYGVPSGLIVGFWWARKGKGFRISDVFTYLAGFFSMIIQCVLYYAILTSILKSNYLNWHLIPPWVEILPGLSLTQFFYFQFILLLTIMPFFLGSPDSISSFMKRQLVVPLLFIVSILMGMHIASGMDLIQPHIIYEMSSPDGGARSTAHKRAFVLLKRYPNHEKWPQIALSHASYLYEQRDFEASKALYAEIIDRYPGSNKWFWAVSLARTALANPRFNEPVPGPALQIPLVDYSPYLTANWMTLLSVIWYWEGQGISESELEIKLKKLSQSDERISLRPLKDFIALDDVAGILGNYDVFILSSDLNRAKDLVREGIPVIHQYNNDFLILYDFDEGRSLFSGYDLSKLSKRFRESIRKESKEILLIEEEGYGESRLRRIRLRNEAYEEYPFDLWDNALHLKNDGPLMAVIFPAGNSELVSAALNMDQAKLKKESDGYLSTLIGLRFLDQADFVNAVEWAKTSVKKISDPLPLYIAHVANVYWQNRGDDFILSNIPLQNQFPDIAGIFHYFSDSENQAFLDRAKESFEKDLQNGEIPWMILQMYTEILDKNDPVEFQIYINILKNRLSADPGNTGDYGWESLANAYEFVDNMPGMVEALEGYISANPFNDQARLRLAKGYILLNQYEKAKSIFQKTDTSELKGHGDLYFCLGAIAEKEGKIKKALKNYEKAIDLCCFRPVYHLRYGRLLLEEGKLDDAARALEWAARIDAGNEIKEEAQHLIMKEGIGKLNPITL
ncbi:MAG: hypothetical protein ACMUIU_10320 [bacterium]